MGLLEAEEACTELEALTEDGAEFQMVLDRRPFVRRVEELAKEALKRLPSMRLD
jgi:hypothetical protein